MAARLSAITGATGFLGSHIAERLAARGQRVRALVRPENNVSLLERLGVELMKGDLSDANLVAALVAEADVVYHCAGKTGNWGAWPEHVAGTIETTRSVVEACQNSPHVQRLLHVSSLAVYGHPRPAAGRATVEEDPLGQHLWLWDYYTRAKIAAEEIVRRLGNRATIIRPTWIYGPRDPANIPAALNAARHGRGWLIGSGDNVLNMVSVAHVAEAAILAANHPAAQGQAYNICGEYQLTQRQMMNMVCTAVGAPLVRRRVPYPIVHACGFLLELTGRVSRRTRKPFITRHGMSVYVRPVDFSWQKAERDLGLRPPADTQERFAETLRWFLDPRV